MTNLPDTTTCCYCGIPYRAGHLVSCPWGRELAVRQAYRVMEVRS